MKTYVLIVSSLFPQKSRRAGEPTGFPDAILSGQKIHTIRANYQLWAKRIAEVQAHKAQLSVRTWTGKPYRSPQREIITLTAKDGVGVETLVLSPSGWHGTAVTVNDYVFSTAIISRLAAADGLSRSDFIDWFEGYDKSEEMAIIHFTYFRYAPVAT